MSANSEPIDSQDVQDLTRSSPPAPLPPPTTVSTRSLRPRRTRGRSSARSSRASTASTSRSRSQSSVANSLPTHLDALPSCATPTQASTGLTAEDAPSDSDTNRGEGSSTAARHQQTRSNHSSVERSAKRRRAGSVGRSPTPVSVTEDQLHTSSRSTPDEHAVAALVAHEDPQPPCGHTTAEDDPRAMFEHMMAESISQALPAHHNSESVPNESGVLLAADAALTYIPGVTAGSSAPHSPPRASPNATAGPGLEPFDHATGVSQGSSLTLPPSASEVTPIQEVEPLASYSCPICFSPPSYATITPCGHVLCGDCLFTAVKTTIQRGAYTLPAGERMVARCPVCRAVIPGWDGKGGGVIGLRPRAVFSL